MNQNPNIEKDKISEKEEKKVMGGSFFTSVLFHGIILLVIGGIVIVPAAVKQLMPVAAEMPPPVTLPEPPPMEEQAPADQSSSDNNGAPSEPADVKATTQDNPGAAPDNLVVQDSSSMGPQIATGNGMDASGVSGDLFSHGRSGNGTGSGGVGPLGSGHKTFFGETGGGAKGLLQGVFYSIYFDKNGQELPQYPDKNKIYIDFVKSHGSANVLSPYWKSKQVYHATHIVIPGMPGDSYFEAFGEKTPKLTRTDQPLFLIHYQGRVAVPSDLTFRFAGTAYGGMVVLVDGNIVFSAEQPDSLDSEKIPHQKSLPIYKDEFNWESPDDVLSPFEHPEQIPANTPGLYPFYVFGSWMTWKANEFHKIDILLGGMNTCILVQEKDKTYKTLPTNIPLLPAFQVGKRENYSPDFIKRNPAYEAAGCDFQIYNMFGVDPDGSAKGPLFLDE